MDAVYLLSPEPHIVDCLMADIECRRYRRVFLVWTSCWFELFFTEFESVLGRRGILTYQQYYHRILGNDLIPALLQGNR